ncbi:MAG: hypothetical protein ACLQGP_17405 [Isosphaeraceae bacterium]
MKTMTLQTTIGPNGAIHLDIPSDLPPGPAEVKLTIQPIPPISNDHSGPASAESESARLLDARTPMAGLEGRSKTCSGLFLGKLPEDYDIDAVLDEMNSKWKAKLQDLGREP